MTLARWRLAIFGGLAALWVASLFFPGLRHALAAVAAQAPRP